VCEVAYAEWTADEQLRQTTFLGWRDDKNAKDVVLRGVSNLRKVSSRSPLRTFVSRAHLGPAASERRRRAAALPLDVDNCSADLVCLGSQTPFPLEALRFAAARLFWYSGSTRNEGNRCSQTLAGKTRVAAERIESPFKGASLL
jgi:hypothetical protein